MIYFTNKFKEIQSTKMINKKKMILKSTLIHKCHLINKEIRMLIIIKSLNLKIKTFRAVKNQI